MRLSAESVEIILSVLSDAEQMAYVEASATKDERLKIIARAAAVEYKNV